MTYCYSPIDNPIFFAEDGSCTAVYHNLKVKGGDLQRVKDGTDKSIVSAVLIQLNTDRQFNGQHGWWGDELSGFSIGTHLWRLKDYPSNERVAMADSMIREALDPIIKQGLIDNFSVDISQIVGGIEAEITIFKDGNALFRVIQ